MNSTQTHVAGVPLKTSKNGDGGDEVKVHEEHKTPRPQLNSPKVPEPVANERPSPAKPARRPWVWALGSVAAVAAIAISVAYYIHSLSFETTDDAFIDGHVIPVSSRVAGHVAKAYVTDNQWVNKGDLLAELDSRDFEARLAAAEVALSAAKAGFKSRSIGVDVTDITSTAGVQEASAAVEGAKASVATAQAAIATAKSQHAQAQAQLAAANAAAMQTQADLVAAKVRQKRAAAFLKRIQALVPERAASQDCLDEAVVAEGVASADVSAVGERIAAQEAVVKQAEAAVAAAESGIRQAEAGVTGQAAAKSAPKRVAVSRSQTDAAEADAARAQAEVNQAKLSLSYTKIDAPNSGHVTRKSVESGAFVQMGQPLLALVDPDLWVVANFKETQLAKMQPGQVVTVTVDTHPGIRFAAHVIASSGAAALASVSCRPRTPRATIFPSCAIVGAARRREYGRSRLRCRRQASGAEGGL